MIWEWEACRMFAVWVRLSRFGSDTDRSDELCDWGGSNFGETDERGHVTYLGKLSIQLLPRCVTGPEPYSVDANEPVLSYALYIMLHARY